MLVARLASLANLARVVQSAKLAGVTRWFCKAKNNVKQVLTRLAQVSWGGQVSRGGKGGKGNESVPTGTKIQ